MCDVLTMTLNGREIHVAEPKQRYMANIADAASKCALIDRVVLFGSSTQTRCQETSDIDLAVFGNQTPSRALTSKSYERFARQLYRFDQNAQAYDILYFQTGKPNESPILQEIDKGEVLYAKA